MRVYSNKVAKTPTCTCTYSVDSTVTTESELVALNGECDDCKAEQKDINLHLPLLIPLGATRSHHDVC